MSRTVLLAVVALTTACERPLADPEGGRSRAPLSDVALRATPGYVVDSILPPEEALRRFRTGLDSVTTLDGAPSREDLVRRFFAALDRRDARALRALAITKTEFAWVAYPGSRLSHPPYYQPPEIAWILLQNPSNTGVGRLLERVAGGQIQYNSHTCDVAEVDGRVVLHRNCRVRVSAAGEFAKRKLFGTIVEHAGRFKFLGFDTDF